MSRVPTPNEVVMRLLQLDRDLDANVDALEAAEADALEKRYAADTADAHAFLKAEGSVDARRKIAFLETKKLLWEADVAEAVVKHLKRRTHAIDHHTDTGRSMNRAVNAESNNSPAGGA